MGVKPGDKTQVHQQYGCQYKFDACNMSFSPRNLTSVSVVSHYARHDVIFVCPAMRKWQRGSVEAETRLPKQFLRKQVCDPLTLVPRSVGRSSTTDHFVISILHSDWRAMILSTVFPHSRVIRKIRSLGIGSLTYHRRHHCHHRHHHHTKHLAAHPYFSHYRYLILHFSSLQINTIQTSSLFATIDYHLFYYCNFTLLLEDNLQNARRKFAQYRTIKYTILST